MKKTSQQYLNSEAHGYLILKAGTLRHPAACPTGRCHKSNFAIRVQPPVNLKYRPQHCCFTSTRRTRNY